MNIWNEYFAPDTQVCKLLKEQAKLLHTNSRNYLRAKVLTTISNGVKTHDMVIIADKINKQINIFSVEEDGDDVLLIVGDSNFYIEKETLVTDIFEVIKKGSFTHRTIQNLIQECINQPRNIPFIQSKNRIKIEPDPRPMWEW